MGAKITGISIERPLGTPIEEVGQGTPFYLVIDWEVSDSSQILYSGDYFDITLPDTLLFPASYTDYEFDITDSDGSVVGTAYVTPGEGNVGGTVRVVFNSNIDGKYSVAGSLNIQAIANTTTIGDDSKIDITVSTTSSSESTDLTVDVTTLDDDELLGKWGVRSDTYSGQVYWYVRINYAQGNLVNATISDSLTGGDGTEQYITDSFTLRRVSFTNTGTVTTLETIDLTDILTFSDDLRSFTIDLSSMPGAYQYVLTYRTTYTSDTTLSNNVNLKSDSTNATKSSSYTAQSASGSADGTLANKIKITKVDANDTTTTLANATFLVTAPNGSTFELTTGDDGTVTSGLLTEGTYTVKETSAPVGYELNDTVYTLEVTSSGGALLTVKDTPITKSVSVYKQWLGDSLDSVTVQLYADGVAYGDPVVLNENMGWSYTWTGLPAYSDGEEIEYTVDEPDVPDGFTAAITDPTEVSGTEISFTVINTQLISVSGTKVWDDEDDQDGVRPDSITVNLLQDGEVIDTQTVTEGDGGIWSFSFDGLAKVDSEGDPYTYTVEEADVPDGYTSAVSSDASGHYTITNTHEPETTSVSVAKAWDDSDDQDGLRPDSVTVQLYADGAAYGDPVELTEGGGWTYTWTDLPMYDSGSAIAYTVEEVDVPDGYTATVSGDAASGFTITNTHTPETTSVSVAKAWDDSDDQDGIRTDSVTVQLYADGAAYGDAVELSSDNDWSYTWPGLDANSAGEAIEYTVAEVDVPDGYTSTVSGDASSGFTITNTHTLETTVSTPSSLPNTGGSSTSTSSSTSTDESETTASTSTGLPLTGDNAPIVPMALLTVMGASLVMVVLKKRRSLEHDE